MFENNEKGSFGSYSSFGRYAAMTHYAIVHKKEFLKGRKEKIRHFDKFFDTQKSEDSSNLNSQFYSIFDNKQPKIQYNRILKICEGEDNENNYDKKNRNNIENNNDNNNSIKELYKYHKQNHKEIFNLILKKKGIKRYDPSSVKYHPKLEYIWKKVLGPPIFSSMTGRNDRKFFGYNLSNSNSSPIILNKNNKMNKKFSKEYICRKAISLLENISNQEKRENSNPEKEKEKRKRNKKVKLNEKLFSTNSCFFKNKEITKNIKINKKIISNLRKVNSVSEINNYKKELLKIHKFPNKKTTTIDFSKTPSREYINYLHRNREISNEYINPNFDVIYPKSISMVKYNNNFTKRKNRNYNEFEGFNFSSYFDITKSFYKINNNKEGKKIIFDHMTSRPYQNNSLPVFMIRNDRNSINSITNKTLEMNNFSNSNFMTNYSSFDKKSFNNKINKNLKKNQKNSFNNCNKLTKNKSSSYLFKYYLNNFEDDSLSKLEDKIDGITFKIYKKKVNLPKEEYDRFIIN